MLAVLGREVAEDQQYGSEQARAHRRAVKTAKLNTQRISRPFDGASVAGER